MADKDIAQPGGYKLRMKQEATGVFTQYVNPASVPGLSIPTHDYIGMSYTGSNLTGVVYKSGGAGGTTVATLTLVYDGSNLTSVTKS